MKFKQYQLIRATATITYGINLNVKWLAHVNEAVFKCRIWGGGGFGRVDHGARGDNKEKLPAYFS